MNYGKTEIVFCKDYEDVGKRGAEDTAALMRSLLSQQDEIGVILAAGESQATFLDALAQQPDIDWGRVVCINIDDFWDQRMDRKYSCGYQTEVQLYNKVNPKAYYLANCNAPSIEEEVRRFEEVIRKISPLDILCTGIGTSGHLGMIEPGQADFHDPRLAKAVDIAEQTKRQVSVDPNFKGLEHIPEKSISMTIPAMLNVKHVFMMVPLAIKRDIMARVLATKEPNENLPASILSTVSCTLYVDNDSLPPDSRT